MRSLLMQGGVDAGGVDVGGVDAAALMRVLEIGLFVDG